MTERSEGTNSAGRRSVRSTAGLGLALPIRGLFVGSIGICRSIEQVRMHMEIIPRDVADVMRKTIKHIAERGRTINDSLGYEFLYDAVVDAERVDASLLRKAVPKNLLFIFAQTIQSIGYAPIEFATSPFPFDGRYEVCRDGHGEERDGNHERKTEHRAVVLCKLRHADELEKFLSGKEKNGSHDTKSYQVAWCELEELKKRLCGFSKHIEMPNVKVSGRRSAIARRKPASVACRRFA